MMNKKMVPVYFDFVADLYDETRTIPDSVVQKAFSFIDDRTSLSESRVILDAGIGTGRIWRVLSQYDLELTGIDISHKMLRKCLERNNDKVSAGKIRLIQGDVACLPFRSSAFDAIIAMHVLEFAEKKATKEIRRVIRPGGFLIIMSYTNPLRETIIAKKYDEESRKRSAGPKERFMSICAGLLPFSIFERAAMLVRRKFSYIEKTAISVQTQSVAWIQMVKTSHILNVLEKRIYSKYFNIPDETHSSIMKNLKKWIEKKGIGDVEEVECNLEIRVLEF